MRAAENLYLARRLEPDDAPRPLMPETEVTLLFDSFTPENRAVILELLGDQKQPQLVIDGLKTYIEDGDGVDADHFNTIETIGRWIGAVAPDRVVNELLAWSRLKRNDVKDALARTLEEGRRYSDRAKEIMRKSAA